MSAEVALVFREECGRPSEKDIISSHLAYQILPDQAVVYGPPNQVQ